MIIDKNTEDTLKQMSKTIYGQALISYLDQARKELDSVSKTRTFDELLGKQYAIKVIDDLFVFMGDREVSTKPKNQYT